MSQPDESNETIDREVSEFDGMIYEVRKLIRGDFNMLYLCDIRSPLDSNKVTVHSMTVVDYKPGDMPLTPYHATMAAIWTVERDINPDLKALNLGLGAGVIHNFIVAHSGDVVTIEINDAIIKLAQRNWGVDPKRVIKGDATTFAYPEHDICFLDIFGDLSGGQPREEMLTCIEKAKASGKTKHAIVVNYFPIDNIDHDFMTDEAHPGYKARVFVCGRNAILYLKKES